MDVSNFISAVGFPIFACCYMFYLNLQAQQAHKEEVQEMSKAIENQKNAIENNTKIMEEVLKHLRKRGDNYD